MVDDDEPVRRAVARRLVRYRPVVTASSVREALVLLDGFGDLAGAVVDVGLPDGTGLELVDALRRRNQSMPVLVFTGSEDPDLPVQARAKGAQFAQKHQVLPHLEALVREVGDAEAVEEGPGSLLASWGLTPHQRAVLLTRMRSPSRAYAARELGISENTLKSLTRTILIKAKQPDLTALAWALLRRAWRDSDPDDGVSESSES